LSVQTALPYGNAIITWTVSEQDYGTKVRMESLLPGNGDEHSHFLNADFVELSLYNLRSYIETGAPACLPEFTGNSESLAVEASLPATANAVFAALTKPEQMDRWVATSAYVDPKVGGTYTYGWTEEVDGRKTAAGPTKILEIESGRLLVHGWFWPGESAPTKVSWEIKGEGATSNLVLTHSGFSPSDKIEGYVQGWAAFLSKLKSLLEGKSLVERATPGMAVVETAAVQNGVLL
jgi:uncharacterized protein YndB with AHSA1/START domain